MKRFVDRLEGGYRVVKIRRIRRYVYLILTLVTLSFAIAVMAANGGSFRPFYLPLDIVIGVLLIMAVVWLALTFVFRNLRIRYATRGSQKFLLAKNSIRRGLAIVVVATIVGVLFIMPFFHSITEDQLTREESRSVTTGIEEKINFWNTDNLGLTRTREVNLQVENSDVRVCFIEGDYVTGTGCEGDPVLAGQNKTYALTQTGYRTYSIVLNSSSAIPARVLLKAEGEVSENLLIIVPATMFLMVIFNVIWVALLFPVRKKFAAASIYSQDYVERVTGDVEVYARRTSVEDRPAARAETQPARIRDAVPAGASQTDAEIPPAEEIAEPPPPPKKEVIPPPELVDTAYLFKEAKDKVSAGDFEAAVEYYDRILDLEPGNIPAIIGKGTAFVSLGREDKTVLCMNDVLEADPRNRVALIWMAKIFESKEKWGEALKWHDRYLGIYPGDENQWIKHGDVLVKMGREDVAIESYRNVLKINPQNEEAMDKLERLKVSVKELMTQALSRSTLGDYVRALELFDRVLRIEPGNQKALLGKGVAYRRLNKIASAIECLNQVLEIDAENQAALLNKGGLLEGQERWEEALYCYNKLVEINPRDEEAWVKKGDVHLNLGMRNEALVSYREALEINPENHDVAQRYNALEDELREVVVEKDVIEQLSEIKGISTKRATLLYEAGFRSINDVAESSVNKLKSIKGISRKTAALILKSVKAQVEDFNKELNKVPGVGPSLAKSIREGGFYSIQQIKSSSPSKLSEIKGISKKKAKKIIEFLNQ